MEKPAQYSGGRIRDRELPVGLEWSNFALGRNFAGV